MQRPHHNRTARATVAWALAAAAAPAAAIAQSDPGFGVPGSTPVQERVVGVIVLGDGAPDLESADQIGAFFNDQLVGVQSVDPDTREFAFIINGDDPETANTAEGPEPGDAVEFRFFDASRNAVNTNVQPLNAAGEPFNYTFDGELLPDLPPGGFPIDLVPTTNIDLRLGDADDTGNGGGNNGGNGGNGGDGGNTGGADPDINGDGRVTTKDAAIVLRLVVGSSFAGVTASNADVTGDGRVDVDDAVFILQNRD
jgi:hypothetical protein